MIIILYRGISVLILTNPNVLKFYKILMERKTLHFNFRFSVQQVEADGGTLHKAESTTMLCDPSESEAARMMVRPANNSAKFLSDEHSMVCDDHQVLV